MRGMTWLRKVAPRGAVCAPIWRSVLCGLLGSCVACAPQSEPAAPVQEPEPIDDGAIPWAPGEEPESTEETTREIEPLPEADDATPPSHYEDDGVHESGAQRCTGKAPPALRALVNERARETGACSKEIPEQRAGAGGDMKVSLKIDTTGAVRSVEFLSDTLQIPAVSQCVDETLKKPFVEAKPRGGCALFVLPLRFESEKVEEPADPEQSE